MDVTIREKGSQNIDEGSVYLKKKLVTHLSKVHPEMNDTEIGNHLPESPKMVAGDGDGIKQNTVRYPTPPVKRYITPVKKNDMKFHLDLSLRPTKGNHMKKKLQLRRNAEIMTVDTPTRITTRKCKPSGDSRVANIYCSPRFPPEKKISKNDAARKIVRYMLLHSWRKSMVLRKELSESLKNRDEKIIQLDMQIDVLKKLRNLESVRREDVHKKYQELQKEVDQLVHENSALKDEEDSMKTDYYAKIKELNEVSSQLKTIQNVCEEKHQVLRILKDKLDKEKEKSRRYYNEKKNSTEQNVKLENMLNIQKEKVDKLTTQIQMLQNSIIASDNAREKSEKTCGNYAEKLREQTLLNEMYKSQILEYERDKNEMNRELKNLQLHLDIAHNEYSHLKSRNDIIEKDILDISEKLDFEKERSPWNMMKKGMSSTYFAVKCLAKLMLPILQSNFRC